jgi:hypothetical protein|tara:strand:+ start:247 stop:684 length:438 start_codon:yes stop_codon:yes gene_type:complete
MSTNLKITMPQLDTVTFLSQLVWTFIVFAGFYLIMVKHILPAISTSVKVRKKKLASIGSLSSDLFDEKICTASSFDIILSGSVASARDSLVKAVEGSSVWQSDSTDTVFTQSSANGSYLETQGLIVGSLILTKALTQNKAEADAF